MNLSVKSRGLLVCLLVSGASSLIYEIAWVRSLELVFGATSFAVATVLAAFMGGLALGSWLIGLAAERLRRFRPLRTYALIESLIALAGLLVPHVLRLLVPVYQSIWAYFHSSFAVFSALRFVLCGVVLLVPTALMGATLPIASRVVAEDTEPGKGAGRGIGLLYSWNTLGGVLGCALAGLLLLRVMGLGRTQWLAVGLNLAAALGAFLLERTQERGALPHSTPSRETSSSTALLPVGRTAILLIILYACSGAVAMLYEVAWSRLLVLVLGSSTYSYTIMLMTFLGGLALGAWFGTRLLKDWPDALMAAALCQVLVALTTYGGLFVLRELPFLYVVAHDRLHPSPHGLLFVQLALASTLMILPTLGLGAMFPVTIDGLRPTGERAPRVVGRAYAWNTVGAIVGSVAGGFWLVPRFGSRDALVIGIFASALLGLCGSILARSAPAARLRLPLAAAVALFLVNLIVAAPVLSPDLLTSGVFRYADRYHGLDRGQFLDLARSTHGEILMFKEGLTCTVSVFRTTSARTLSVNGKPDASAPPGLPEPYVRRLPYPPGDLSTQVLVAQLPLLLAPRSDHVLVVGLGSGVTLGSALTHPVKEVECVEIEDAVVRGSRFFDDVSGAPLGDARVHLVVNDARNHLLVGRSRYDVIMSEPSNPWVTGAASLFTRDFFELAGSRLAPGGLFGQWLQLYEMRAEDFQAILRSFTAVFPDVQIFRVASDAVLVGSKDGPIRMDPILRAVEGRVAADLRRIGIDAPEDLLAHHWIGGVELRAALGPGPMNTDDNMLIELTAPLRMLSRLPGELRAQNRELATLFDGRTGGVLPHLGSTGDNDRARARFWARVAQSTLADGYAVLSLRYAAHSLQIARSPAAARVIGESLARAGRYEAALTVLASARREFPRDAGLVGALAEIERSHQDWPALHDTVTALTRLAPGDRRAIFWAGESLYHLGRFDAAYATLRPLVAQSRDSAVASGSAAVRGPSPLDEYAGLDLMLGTLAVIRRPAAAVEPLRHYLRSQPSDGSARALLATALERAGRAAEAVVERRRLEPDAPRLAAERLIQAEQEWETGSRVRTHALLREAFGYDPANEPITFLLARSWTRLGDRERAAALLEEFLDTHPDRSWAVGYLGQLNEDEGRTDRATILAQRHLALTGRLWERIPEN